MAGRVAEDECKIKIFSYSLLIQDVVYSGKRHQIWYKMDGKLKILSISCFLGEGNHDICNQKRRNKGRV